MNSVEPHAQGKMSRANQVVMVFAAAVLWVSACPAKAQTKATAPKPALTMPVPAAQDTKALPKPTPTRTPTLEVKEAAPQAARAGYVIAQAKLGNGLQIEDLSGQWALRLTGRLQADYRQYSDDAALADTFSIRRARLGMGLNLASKFSVFAEGEFASGTGGGGTAQNANLQQGYVEFAPHAAAKVRLGQFKPEFGLENMTSAWNLDFMERAFHSQLLQSFDYDRGVMVHGVPFQDGYYGVSFMNGTANNTDELQRTAADAKTDDKDLIIRLAANVAPWIKNAESVIHVGGDWRTAKVANAPGSASNNGYVAASFITEARGLTFFAAEELNSLAPSMSDEITRTIIGGEFALAWREFKFQTENFVANYEVRENATGTEFSRDIKAGYLSASWLMTGEHFSDAYVNGAFGRIRPKQNFSSGGLGAWQIGVRYSYVDASDFSNSNAINTGRTAPTSGATSPVVSILTTKAHAITLGLKWMPEAYSAVYLNVVQTSFDTPVTVNGLNLDKEQAITLRAALEFF